MPAPPPPPMPMHYTCTCYTVPIFCITSIVISPPKLETCGHCPCICYLWYVPFLNAVRFIGGHPGVENSIRFLTHGMAIAFHGNFSL
ncbi:hypothetical protein FKM82_007814 [Ascaphus truei]